MVEHMGAQYKCTDCEEYFTYDKAYYSFGGEFMPAAIGADSPHTVYFRGD